MNTSLKNHMLAAGAVGVLALTAPNQASAAVLTGGVALNPQNLSFTTSAVVNDALTLSAATYGYILVGVTGRASSPALAGLTVSVDGGGPVALSQITYASSISQSYASVWGVALNGTTAASNVDFTFSTSGTGNYAVNFLQATATSGAISVAGFGSGTGAQPYTTTLTGTTSADDLVFATQYSRGTSSLIAFAGTIGTPALSALATGTVGGGTGHMLTGYWDNASGTNLTIAVNASDGNANGGLAAVRLSAVPEPSTVALAAGCLALGLVMLRRRR